MKSQSLPKHYQQMTTDEALSRIARYKESLAGRMVVLAHHYQRDEIVGIADFTGDSLELSQIAARQKEAEYIIFCGVHFMAESGDILTSDRQKVLLPEITAGCSMADMAVMDQVQTCWDRLCTELPGRTIVPITYVNSTASIKAFCGRNGGTCCTSSNSREIFSWAWRRDPESVILFLPDEHLGRNTAYGMEVALDQMSLWDPQLSEGGIGRDGFKASRMVLWKGYCSVHQEFTAEQIERIRQQDPQVRVIVHPECCFEVVQNADDVGSTSYIIKTIHAADRGSRWAVGTEIHLVNRLAKQMADKGVEVRCLSETACECETMARVSPQHVAWLMERISEHVVSGGQSELVNRVVVPEKEKGDARAALERMLEITAAMVKS